MAKCPAYDLACSLEPVLLEEYSNFESCLDAPAQKRTLQTFKCIVHDGKIAINMSLAGGLQFLESGKYLNIYEKTEVEEGATGAELERHVKNRLGEWFEPRRKIDELFQFQHDTHYASLNVAGGGAQRYGLLCFIFEIPTDLHVTCFGGDSIRACYSTEKKQVLANKDILNLFSTVNNTDIVASLKHKHNIQTWWSGQPALLTSEVQSVLENSDSLIEMHVHGPISSDAIKKVVIKRDEYQRLMDLSRRAEYVPAPRPQEYDSVPVFNSLIKLINDQGIRFVAVE